MEYPIIVLKSVYKESLGSLHQELADLGEKGDWDGLLKFLQSNKFLINTARLPIENDSSPPTLFTPLHYAADGNASKEIFQALLNFGSAKCLKNADGETAYDIGKRKGLSPEILELIKISKELKQNEVEIKAMETGLHSVIKERVANLINKNKQELPQVAFLYEKGDFYYPVPGMYGGFSIRKSEKGVTADSWSRICGGSEQNHLIERDGKVTLLPNDNPL